MGANVNFLMILSIVACSLEKTITRYSARSVVDIIQGKVAFNSMRTLIRSLIRKRSVAMGKGVGSVVADTRTVIMGLPHCIDYFALRAELW